MQGFVEVETGSGRVRGIEHAGVRSFLGVPYGGPTGENGRFLLPRPVQPWVGVRDALSFGPAAPQPDGRLGATGAWVEALNLIHPRTGSQLEGSVMSEDCLALNVWAPATEPSRQRPVMVWLHGGAFVTGTGSETVTLGDQLAADEDVVVVAVNHRLGLFGYLPLELAGGRFQDAGVAGMLDLVLALEWVRDNIASFGGDPANVTVFGISGGGGKILSLMAMPVAEGLFHKAIIMSGSGVRTQTLEDAEALLDIVLDIAGLTRRSAERLVALSFRDLLGVQGRIFADGRGPFRLDLDAETPALSGPFLSITPPPHPHHLPVAALRPGAPDISHIPLLLGNTTHEMAMILSHHDGFREFSDERLLARLNLRHGVAGPDVYKQLHSQYPDERPHLLLARDLTDGASRLGTVGLAERKARQAAPVYLYEFGYQTPVLDGLLGAFHGSDLPFAFNTVGRAPVTGELPNRYDVAAAMARAFATFARTGAPDHSGIPTWPRYDSSSRATMRIGTRWQVHRGPTIAALGKPISPLWSAGTAPEDMLPA